jgi:Mg/Co/Ni transporter MgtE
MSVCPQVIDDKSYRRLVFNECVSRKFRSLLEDETWVGVFLGAVFAALITIGVAINGSLTAMLSWIALVWGGFVGVPLLLIFGVALYECYPLLRFRCKLECIAACESSNCLNRCDEAFWYMC